MVPAEKKGKRLLYVNHTAKTIHHQQQQQQQQQQHQMNKLLTWQKKIKESELFSYISNLRRLYFQ